tara:strand:+ start:1417 stop:1842 length:426 start_codon:yes stop_codon:yes gene_type:complete
MINTLNIYIEKLISEPLKLNSDTIGALASGLCMAHCIATPFFFIASACSSSCCDNSPIWWQWLDYFFLFISFFAINQSTKSRNNEWIKFGLWISWTGLFLSILNVKFGWIYLAENVKYIPAFMLVALHMYNMKFCQCKDCC